MEANFVNKNGVLTFSLVGDVDDANINKLRNIIDSILESEKYYEVIFDFTNVIFMDSTGIGFLLGRYKHLEKISVPMYVKGVNSQVDKVFYTSGIYEIIKKIA